MLSRVQDISLFSFPIKSLLEFDNITGQEHRCSSNDLEEAHRPTLAVPVEELDDIHSVLRLQTVRPFPSAQGQWGKGNASQF